VAARQTSTKALPKNVQTRKQLRHKYIEGKPILKYSCGKYAARVRTDISGS
jgi:hypothetical protein